MAVSDAPPQHIQPPPSCDVTTASLEERQAVLRQLQELERRQQMKEQTMLEWIIWKQVCEDLFQNNPAYLPDDDSKVN